MWQFIAFLRGLFAAARPQSRIADFHDRKRGAPAVDPLAVLMLTHRWTTS
jgi:hypothetical protein